MIKLPLLLLILIPQLSHAEQNSSDMGGLSSFLLFPVLFILMYLLLIRPQTKKAKEHKTLLTNLKVNDEVITQGGMIGKIIKITDQFIIVSLNMNTEVIIKKDAIISSLPKGTMKQIK